MAARRTVEANVSAAKRADAASAAAANNEAAASAAKHAYVASAARRSYGGRANETGGGRVRGRCPQGRRRGNGLRRDARARDDVGPTHGDEEAAAVASTTTPMMALPCDDESNDDAHQGAQRRPPRATKAARRTGVDEAAFALTRMMPRTMTSPPAMRTPTTAPTTMPTTTPRGAQSQGRPGRLTSTAQGAYARRPPPTTATNSDDSADKVEKPRATDKANEATGDCARRVRVAVARKSAMAT